MSRLRYQPEWAIDILKKMIDLKLSKRDIAKALKINYQQFCNITNGNVINTKHKENIIAYVNNLYESEVKTYVPQTTQRSDDNT